MITTAYEQQQQEETKYEEALFSLIQQKNPNLTSQTDKIRQLAKMRANRVLELLIQQEIPQTQLPHFITKYHQHPETTDQLNKILTITRKTHPRASRSTENIGYITIPSNTNINTAILNKIITAWLNSPLHAKNIQEATPNTLTGIGVKIAHITPEELITYHITQFRKLILIAQLFIHEQSRRD